MIAGHEDVIRQRRELWQERAELVWQQIATDIEQAVPDPDQIVWPALKPDEEADPLFDSRRDYLDQMDRFKLHQGKIGSDMPEAAP